MLPPDTLREMFSQAEERSFRKGDVLLSQGDDGDGLLVLTRGLAYARNRDHDGERLVGHFRTSDLVGEMALVTREPRTADVIALSDVSALWLSSDAFNGLAARHLELCGVLTDLVAERLGQGVHDGLGGKAVNGFRIVRCIGRGGMAIVYEAVSQATSERVALKMMSHRLTYDRGALARFRQEASLLQAIAHENVVRLEGLFPAYGTYFIVMEFCDGVDLDRLVRAEGPLGESQVRAILGQLARALSYLHQRNVIHRDIKPSNVMITRDGVVKLMDFGLAAPALALDDETRTVDHAVLGTPAYMAPELFSGRPPDVRSDVYALACLAYGLLTGERLFHQTTLPDMMGEKLRPHLPPPARIGSGISDELHGLLERALRSDREERLPDVTPFVGWAAGGAPPPAFLFDTPRGPS